MIDNADGIQSPPSCRQKKFRVFWHLIYRIVKRIFKIFRLPASHLPLLRGGKGVGGWLKFCKTIQAHTNTHPTDFRHDIHNRISTFKVIPIAISECCVNSRICFTFRRGGACPSCGIPEIQSNTANHRFCQLRVLCISGGASPSPTNFRHGIRFIFHLALPTAPTFCLSMNAQSQQSVH